MCLSEFGAYEGGVSSRWSVFGCEGVGSGRRVRFAPIHSFTDPFLSVFFFRILARRWIGNRISHLRRSMCYEVHLFFRFRQQLVSIEIRDAKSYLVCSNKLIHHFSFHHISTKSSYSNDDHATHQVLQKGHKIEYPKGLIPTYSRYHKWKMNVWTISICFNKITLICGWFSASRPSAIEFGSQKSICTGFGSGFGTLNKTNQVRNCEIPYIIPFALREHQRIFSLQRSFRNSCPLSRLQHTESLTSPLREASITYHPPTSRHGRAVSKEVPMCIHAPLLVVTC